MKFNAFFTWLMIGQMVCFSFSGCGGKKGSSGRSTPPRPPRVTGGSESEGQDRNGKGNDQRVSWEENLADAPPPKKKLTVSPQAGGICAQLAEKSRRCLDEMVDVVVAKFKAGPAAGSSRLSSLKTQLRQTLTRMLNSGQLQKGCVMMLTKKNRGSAFKEKTLFKCVHASTCREFAECFYSSLLSSSRRHWQQKSSP